VPEAEVLPELQVEEREPLAPHVAEVEQVHREIVVRLPEGQTVEAPDRSSRASR
jgi:hypothetical protein